MIDEKLLEGIEQLDKSKLRELLNMIDDVSNEEGAECSFDYNNHRPIPEYKGFR